MVRLAKKFNLTLCQVGFNEKVDDEWISVVDGKPKPKVKEVTELCHCEIIMTTLWKTG